MIRKYTTTHMQSPWKIVIGLLCIALVLLGGTLSVVHSHNQGSVSRADCGLCVTAHLTIQLTAAPPQIPASEVYSKVEAALPVARPRTLSRFALFTRPPPANA